MKLIKVIIPVLTKLLMKPVIDELCWLPHIWIVKIHAANGQSSLVENNWLLNNFIFPKGVGSALEWPQTSSWL